MFAIIAYFEISPVCATLFQGEREFLLGGLSLELQKE